MRGAIRETGEGTAADEPSRRIISERIILVKAIGQVSGDSYEIVRAGQNKMQGGQEEQGADC